MDAQRALDAHLHAGRLQVEEYADRYGRAGNAMTAADLAALFADLPAPRPKLPRGSGQVGGSAMRLGLIALAVVVVVVVVVLAVGLTNGGSGSTTPVAQGVAGTSTPPVTALAGALTTAAAPSSTSALDPSVSASATASGDPLPASSVYLIANEPVDREQSSGGFDTGSYNTNGMTFGHAITVHASCYNSDGGDYWLDYDLGRQWSTLTVTVGMRDDSPATAKASYTVLADSVAVANGQLSLGSSTPLSISVKNVLRLRLRMNNPDALSNGCRKDPDSTQVVWGDPQLTH